MNLLRIDSSIQGPASASSELADLAEAAWLEVRPETTITRRHLAADPLPAEAWALAATAGYTPEDQRSADQKDAAALAATLYAELTSADALLLALPLYNFGVSQHVKTWIDLVIAGGVNGVQHLEGKPVILVTTRGGAYGEGTPRAGWDHNTPYLARILGDSWGGDVTVIEREFTLVGLNPALDEFKELAAVMKKTAHEAAAEAGRTLAAR